VRCVGAILARNEADRYLPRVLENVKQFCDQIVVVDDGSTDNTVEVCRNAGAAVLKTTSDGWWGKNESSPRELLWRFAADEAGPDGWIYVADADHELIGITPSQFKVLLKAQGVNCWAFPLWDCWDSDTLHRVDGYWQAWRNPRPWLFRSQPNPGFTPVWASRGIHAGHCPSNYPLVAGLVPHGVGLRHLGYVRKADREAKAAKYLAVANAATA